MNSGRTPGSNWHDTLLKNQANFSDDENEPPKLSRLLDLIECPVCREIPSPPIYNCENGHFACATCLPRLTTNRCPYCLATFTRMRNYPLESLVTTGSVPCDFVQFGCTQDSLTLLEYERHVESCWAQIWRPGKIIQHSKKSHAHPHANNSSPLQPCPRCQQENSTRKVKCRKCDGSLRPPTPMKELTASQSQLNFVF
ncbi:putative E3 ubiquitin-protein ligase SINA-like 9 isoform X2 [Folsomia candida]|nr:putative E3 ubiquitin-protein ligase SINA-like 9 isoform X2 [Folsomia candida]XP_035710721.1 putative E3 ubiquitin-protein ligase SINA-like 9 isoform X2 [Folsomia candida]